MRCSNQLKQISLALHNYCDDYGRIPTATVANPELPFGRRLSWSVGVLPYVGQADLYRDFDMSAAWDSPGNARLGASRVYVFRCPDWEREHEPAQDSWTSYVGCSGVGLDAADLPAGHPRAGLFGHERTLALADVSDGTANTFTVLETARDNGPWSRGGRSTLRGFLDSERPFLGAGRPFGDTHFDEKTLWFWGGDSLGMQAGFCDGSVRLFRNDTDPELLKALATTHGREPIDWQSSGY